MNDLSIDDLLAAVSTKPKPKQRSYTEPKQDTDYISIPCIITCKCRATYHATATRPKKWYDDYKSLNYHSFICPKCITEENWLEHFYDAKIDRISIK